MAVAAAVAAMVVVTAVRVALMVARVVHGDGHRTGGPPKGADPRHTCEDLRQTRQRVRRVWCGVRHVCCRVIVDAWCGVRRVWCG